jgi:hypothetical protein
MHYLKIKELAAEFRTHPTKAEQYLWTFLGKRKLSGKKFLRQHPIIYKVTGKECFFFIPDFTVLSTNWSLNLMVAFMIPVLKKNNAELSNIESVLCEISRNLT